MSHNDDGAMSRTPQGRDRKFKDVKKAFSTRDSHRGEVDRSITTSEKEHLPENVLVNRVRF